MKKFAQALLIMLLLFGTALAQVLTVNEVPPVVKNSFRNRFPGVKRVEWKFKYNRNYEAGFMLKGKEIAVKFDSTGKWLETESAASRASVPSEVLDTIAQHFKGYKVVEIQTVQSWNDQHVVWEIHLEGANEIVKAQFNGNGTIISRSAKPKSDKKK